MVSLITLVQGLCLHTTEDIPQGLGAVRLLDNILWGGVISGERGMEISAQTGIGIVMTQLGTGPTVHAQLRVRPVLTQLRVRPVRAVELGVRAMSAQLRVGPVGGGVECHAPTIGGVERNLAQTVTHMSQLVRLEATRTTGAKRIGEVMQSGWVERTTSGSMEVRFRAHEGGGGPLLEAGAPQRLEGTGVWRGGVSGGRLVEGEGGLAGGGGGRGVQVQIELRTHTLL